MTLAITFTNPDQEESKLNSTNIASSGYHTPTDDKIEKFHSIRIT